jgi:glycosyltransferase involved in cell wall biosynthesis
MVARTFLPESRGGMENHAFQLAQVLLAKGHDLGILHLVFDEEQVEYQVSASEWQGMSIFKLVRHRSPSWPNPYRFHDRQVEIAFEGILAGYEPDLVHFHHLADLSASLPGSVRRRGIPSLHTLHDFWPMCFVTHLRMPNGELCPGPDEGLRCAECLWMQWQAGFQMVSVRPRMGELGIAESLRRAPRFLADWVAARLGGSAATSADLRSRMVSLFPRNDFLREALMTCDLLISPSRFLLDRFVEWGIPASHFRHVYNSVPHSLLEMGLPAREQRDAVVFGFIGTLYPPKGVDVLLDAFQELNPGSASLEIWGTPPHVGPDDYARQMKERGRDVPKVEFKGGFPPEDLDSVLQQIDVLVMPSIWYENNPIVILEALAARAPVIAGDIGGMAELIEHDVNGLLFRAGDAHDLANKMGMMLEPHRLQSYRDAIVPPWSHEEMANHVLGLYGALMDSYGGIA